MRSLHASIRGTVCSFCGNGSLLMFVSSLGGAPAAICTECANRALAVLTEVEAADAAAQAPAPKRAPKLMASRF